jgi:urease accessory protein
VIASAAATIRPGGVLGPVRCQPPLTLRRVHHDDPSVCSVGLVGSAAGPLAGDELSLHLDIEDGAAAELRATGASIAQGRASTGSSLRMTARVGSDASLVADPGPLIVCEGSRVDVSVGLELHSSSEVQWSETVVLGRSADRSPGAAVLEWDVRRDGRPLLRQRVDLTEETTRSWLVSGHRVLASVLLAGPSVRARTVVRSRTSVAQRIDEQALLITVLAMDGASAVADVDRLLADVRGAVVAG